MENIEGSYKMPDPTLNQKVDQLLALSKEGSPENPRKAKTFRMPFRGKVGKTKLKNGFATVLEIAENDVVSFTKEEIREGTIKLGDTFHSVDDTDILTYKGKPLVIVPKKSNQPFNPNRTKNTTFSQKHIMSRMMNETIDKAKKMGIAGASIGGIILVAALAWAFIGG